MVNILTQARWCCHICPRDSYPRRPGSKGTNVQGTVVQWDFGPRRLLSKEAFTSDKLAQIIFFLLYWISRYWLIIKWRKNNMNSLSPWTKVSLDQCLLGQKSSWTKVSLDNCPLDKCSNTEICDSFLLLQQSIIVQCCYVKTIYHCNAWLSTELLMRRRIYIFFSFVDLYFCIMALHCTGYIGGYVFGARDRCGWKRWKVKHKKLLDLFNIVVYSLDIFLDALRY